MNLSYSIPAGEFYRQFRAYCEKWDRPGLSMPEIKSAMFHYGCRYRNANGVREYLGIRLKPAPVFIDATPGGVAAGKESAS